MILHRLWFYLSYVLVGSVGVLAASYLTSAFMKPAQSQEFVPTQQVREVKNNAGKPEIKSQNLEKTPKSKPKEPSKLDPSRKTSLSAVQDNNLEFEQEGEFSYDPSGLRDPFKPFFAGEVEIETTAGEEVRTLELEELQKFNLNELKIVGMIWNVKKPKVILLDPKGKTHTVKKNSKVGNNNGYVGFVREGEMVVVEKLVDEDGKTSYNTKTLFLDR